MRLLFASLVAATLAVASATPSESGNGVITLTWTAPGDDGMTGKATVYDLRHSPGPILPSVFPTLTRVLNLPPPATPGTKETYTVTGLTPGAVYFFAIRAGDEAGNWSAISNNTAKMAVSVVDVPTGTPAVLSFSHPFPNPARSHASFSMTLPEPTEIKVEVFDVQGRSIRMLADGAWPAGETSVAWNLRDRGGMKVSPGAYLVRAQLGATSMVRRVVVVG